MANDVYEHTIKLAFWCYDSSDQTNGYFRGYVFIKELNDSSSPFSVNNFPNGRYEIVGVTSSDDSERPGCILWEPGEYIERHICPMFVEKFEDNDVPKLKFRSISINKRSQETYGFFTSWITHNEYLCEFDEYSHTYPYEVTVDSDSVRQVTRAGSKKLYKHRLILTCHYGLISEGYAYIDYYSQYETPIPFLQIEDPLVQDGEYRMYLDPENPMVHYGDSSEGAGRPFYAKILHVDSDRRIKITNISEYANPDYWSSKLTYHVPRLVNFRFINPPEPIYGETIWSYSGDTVTECGG